MASKAPPTAKLPVRPTANHRRRSHQKAQRARRVKETRPTIREGEERSGLKTPAAHPSSRPPVGSATATRTAAHTAKIRTMLRHEGTKHTKINNQKHFVSFVSLWLALYS